jgi:hypothetical protein
MPGIRVVYRRGQAESDDGWLTQCERRPVEGAEGMAPMLSHLVRRHSLLGELLDRLRAF